MPEAPLPEESGFSPTVELSEEERPPRFPVRWQFALWTALAVIVSVAVVLLITLTVERGAWLKNQTRQARADVEKLADELKIPVLAGSRAEIDIILKHFLEKTPSAVGVHLRMADGSEMHAGKLDLRASPLNTPKPRGMWFTAEIRYAGTPVGQVAVLYSEEAWRALARSLVVRILLGALVVVMAAVVGVYWLAGRMSRPLEELAEAARAVAYGDYTVRLPVRSNDEIGDAVMQFNAMVAELQHKEELRGTLEQYLNPQVVDRVLAGEGLRRESRRQEVSVLFADMVNFTAFSEALPTERVIDVLNQYFEVFHRIIDHFGGFVDKYIGDAVMAVFNHPQSDAMHPRHAVLAGLAMGDACRRMDVLHPKDQTPIRFRVGANCGEVIVGEIGAEKRLQFTVIGDTVNVASRLSGLAEGGQIVITRAMFARLGEGFAFRSLGERKIKGIERPVECGVVEPADRSVEDEIHYAVARALDLTLPSGSLEVLKQEGKL